jgi:hypothetical protein
VGGGKDNTAGGDWYATVAGGLNNTAGEWATTVGGGSSNEASGNGATVPGGRDNNADGDYSLAAGYRAKANHDGAFVWGDFSEADVESERDNQFRVRASGGARFDVNGDEWVAIYDDGADLIATSSGAHLTLGGAWTDSSDRDLKENFAPVDGREVLDRLAELPISTWNYKAEDASVRHMGPVAQDFYAAFGLGQDERHIASLDSSGVALVAIQELQEVVEEKDAEIAALEARVAALEAAAAGPMQGGILPGAGVLLAGLALVWVTRRGGVT